MEPAMIELRARTDEHSLQITAEGSKRFFVRVVSPRSSKRTIIFSDFNLNADDDDRAVEALHLLKEHGFQLGSGMRLEFRDIHPSYSDLTDRSELIRRHDQIVSVVKAYAAQAGLRIYNSFLESSDRKTGTIVLIE